MLQWQKFLLLRRSSLMILMTFFIQNKSKSYDNARRNLVVRRDVLDAAYRTGLKFISLFHCNYNEVAEYRQRYLNCDDDQGRAEDLLLWGVFHLI